MMEDWNSATGESQINSNGLTSDYVEYLHKLRKELLQGIQLGDRDLVMEIGSSVSKILGEDELKILKRVPDNKVRSYKNILLSHNTLYSYVAELGGLSPWQGHFMSEKYAVMIEHAEHIFQLEKVHLNMLNEYADQTIRIKKNENLSIVGKAVNYIEMNFAEDISIEEMARKLHVHPSHLMRAFKNEKGMTISHYRNLRRTREAKQLILHSDLSMTEIAIMIGFNNSQYF